MMKSFFFFPCDDGLERFADFWSNACKAFIYVYSVSYTISYICLYKILYYPGCEIKAKCTDLSFI